MKLVRFIDFFDYDGLYKKVLKMNNPKQRLQGYSFPQPLSIKQVSSVNILQPPPSSNLPKFNLIPNHQNKHQQPRSFLPVIFSTQQKQVGGSAEEMDEKGDYGSDLKSSQEESYIMRKPPPSIEFIVLQNQLNLMKNNNFPKINRIQDIFGNKDRVSSKLFLTESQLISPLTKPIIADKQSTAYKPIRQGNRLSIKQHPSIELKVSQSNVSKVSYQSQQSQQQKGDQLDNLQEIVRRKKQDNKKLQSLYRSILQLEVSQGKQSVKQAFLGKTEQIIQFKKILEGSFNVHSNFKAK